MKKKSSILESVVLLSVLGILAGALGGLAIGVVTMHSSSSSSAAQSAAK
jgi:hypothetical protein